MVHKIEDMDERMRGGDEYEILRIWWKTRMRKRTKQNGILILFFI